MSAADLERLALSADSLAAEPADDGTGRPPPAAEPVASLAESNTMALCMVAALFRAAITTDGLVFTPGLESPGRLLADDKLPGLLGPWAVVLSHYGVDVGRIIPGADHPAMLALFTTGPALLMLFREVGDELRARRAKPIRPDTASGD